MSQFPIHSILTANATAKPLLEGSLKKYGFVPNLHGGLAEVPIVVPGRCWRGQTDSRRLESRELR